MASEINLTSHTTCFGTEIARLCCYKICNLQVKISILTCTNQIFVFINGKIINQTATLHLSISINFICNWQLYSCFLKKLQVILVSQLWLNGNGLNAGPISRIFCLNICSGIMSNTDVNILIISLGSPNSMTLPVAKNTVGASRMSLCLCNKKFHLLQLDPLTEKIEK